MSFVCGFSSGGRDAQNVFHHMYNYHITVWLCCCCIKSHLSVGRLSLFFLLTRRGLVPKNTVPHTENETKHGTQMACACGRRIPRRICSACAPDMSREAGD